MAKKEVKTDLWVARQLDDSQIKYDAQGSNVKEINIALQSASKRGTGKVGYPEYVAVVKDFVIVIEDKADLTKHQKLTDTGILSIDQKDIANYAVNGAYFYAKHIAQNSTFHKIFAIGVAGDEKHHKITPLYVDDREGYKVLPNIESFTSFTVTNIDEYYTRYVLAEKTDVEKTTEEILKDAAELHEYLRTYGSLKDQDKPLVVSGILLALDDKFFKPSDLLGDETTTDGQLIYDAIQRRLKASNVGPDAKRDKLMSEFSIIRTSARLNEIDQKLGKTPLKFYTEFLKKNVFDNIKYRSSSEDFIGRFYGEFMSYSGGDGQTLGIVLTPRHICDLFCDLLNIQATDIVLDPCCGTAGFLVAAMHHMLEKAGTDQTKRKSIKKKQLHGFELQSNMFAIAATNMILRDDGNSNIKCEDFLRQNPAQVQLKGATVGMMNPPYSQGTKADPSQYELSFVEHLLDSLTEGARAAVIVPQSSMTGKTKDEQAFKENILKQHTLEGVITCNTDTFYGVGTNPVIAIFTAHEPHPADKLCKFIDFRDDGYEVRAHVGLVEGDSTKDKRQHLLDVWFGRTEAASKFCVESTVKTEDEWLHSFYYFNDNIPTDADFERGIGDYLAFEFSMIMLNREYLFEQDTHEHFDLKYIMETTAPQNICALDNIDWEPVFIADIFYLVRGREGNMAMLENGDIPLISAKNSNNGLKGFVNTPKKAITGHSISLNNDGDGGAGLAYYQPANMALDTHVTALIPKHHVSKWTLIFIAKCISGLHGFFGHGLSISNKRADKIKIMLPVTEDGVPDYGYMDRYVKNKMIQKYKQYLAYLDSKQNLNSSTTND